MKIRVFAKFDAFTLSEMMIAAAITSTILAVTLTCAVALQKSLSQIDNYASAHVQQIRIVDYLARDVRRGLSVTSSVDRQTVTISIPKYLYQAGDSDLPNASKIGTPRPPRRAYVANSGDSNINYADTTSTVQYRVQNSSILRVQDGVLTTIASSTDNLVPETTDVELSNTEYTSTVVTFKPISAADRSSTSVYSTAYLRNRRRLAPATPTPAP